jgi:hypothetical protein
LSFDGERRSLLCCAAMIRAAAIIGLSESRPHRLPGAMHDRVPNDGESELIGEAAGAALTASSRR